MFATVPSSNIPTVIGSLRYALRETAATSYSAEVTSTSTLSPNLCSPATKSIVHVESRAAHLSWQSSCTPLIITVARCAVSRTRVTRRLGEAQRLVAAVIGQMS